MQLLLKPSAMPAPYFYCCRTVKSIILNSLIVFKYFDHSGSSNTLSRLCMSLQRDVYLQPSLIQERISSFCCSHRKIYLSSAVTQMVRSLPQKLSASNHLLFSHFCQYFLTELILHCLSFLQSSDTTKQGQYVLGWWHLSMYANTPAFCANKKQCRTKLQKNDSKLHQW